MRQQKTFIESVKSDVREAACVYFAPVRAVVREFSRIVGRSESAGQPAAHKKPKTKTHTETPAAAAQ